MAAGIRSGRSAVISAASEVAQAAITAAQNKLQIHSPSRVFWGMGENSGEAYADGLESKKAYVRRSVMDALQFSAVKQAVSSSNMNFALGQLEMSLPQVNESEIYQAVYAAIIDGMANDNMSAEFIRAINNLARRPIQTQFNINSKPFAEATAQDMTIAQQKGDRIKNMLSGVKG